MITQLTRDDFLKNLCDSGLLSADDIDTLLTGLPVSHVPDCDALVEHLVANGKLTHYQAKAVRERRFAELIIGNYTILDRLGAGGMGTVFKAQHRRMKRVVALKLLSPDVAKSETFVRRFQREVEAAARLSHPNIVMAHDADEAEAGHFLVMEFVNGQDLASSVQKHGSLPIAEAVDCIIQAARALEYAHSQGIVHRDIKPANLLRDAGGVVKVADLGLARVTDPLGSTSRESGSITQAGTIMGTVDYMSPEQALGLTTIDHRTDIYSLGCTLFYLLLGRPPFQGSTLMATLVNHRESPIPALRETWSIIPASLDRVYQKMLAKKPDERFANMREVIQALESLSISGELPRDSYHSTGAAAAAATQLAPPAVGTPSTAPGTIDLSSQTADFSCPREASQATASILLVEPSRMQATIIRKYLDEIGFRDVRTATSGQKALESAHATAPQIVVSAMHLPDMTGTQLARAVRPKASEPVPGFVLITSQDDGHDAELHEADLGIVRLPKPFDVDQLAQAMAAAVAAQPVQPPSAVREARSRLRVLVVDDSAPARMHIRGVLRGLGFTQFVEAIDGARAVAAVASERFDLIVTDFNMPYLDGGGLVDFLKRNPATAAVPILMVTTETNPEKLEPVRRLGVAICDKSFSPQLAKQLIDQLVGTP